MQCHSLAFYVVCLDYVFVANLSLDAYLVLALTDREEIIKYKKPEHKRHKQQYNAFLVT